MFGFYNLENKEFFIDQGEKTTFGDIVVCYKGNLFSEKKGDILNGIAVNFNDPEYIEGLQGQFAIVIFDNRRKTLLLIRDHLGVVPLYYASEVNRFIFGTSIKPILTELGGSASLNENVIHEYFTFRYVSGKDTFFKNIFEVKPGSMLRVDNLGKLSGEDYYHLRYSNEFAKGDSRSHEMFQEAFSNSFNLQTQDKYERKIGVLSSGGIDSSILVSYFRRVTRCRFRTYYVGFEGYEHNRLGEVNRLSKLCDTDQENVLISNEHYSDNLIESIKINEEPLNHPCSVALKYLYERIKGEMEILLSGEGADCLYCGYFVFNLINWFYVKNPVRFLTLPFGKIVEALLGRRRGRGKVDKVIAALTVSPDMYAIGYGDFPYNTKEGVDNLLMTRFPVTFGENYVSGLSNYSKKNVLDLILKLYQTHFLVEELNTLSKLGNNYGIEIRYPFIDIKLVNLFNSLPSKERIELLRRKHQVYAIAKKCLPKEILGKPKEGFGVPLYSWFYDEKGLGRFIGLLSDKRTRERGVFEVDYLEKLLDDYQSRRLSDDSFECIIWPIINFELWNRIFVDKKPVDY
jgi:asparagine synthase (glutamine-hydrolysing)